MTTLAVVACLIAAAAVLRWWFDQRQHRRELDHLGAQVGVVSPASMRDIGRCIVELHQRSTEAEELAALFARAIDAGEGGALVVDRGGREVARTGIAHQIHQGRYGLALARPIVQDAVASALQGVASLETIQIVGPPSRTIRLVGVPLITDGELLGGMVTATDTSHDALTDRVRRDFVANLSHELKTPVAAIGLLAETIEGEPDDTVRDRLLGRISSEVDRVAAIIDDLLNLSRLEFERDRKRDVVDLASVIAEAADRVAQQALSRSVVMKRNPTQVSVMGDRDLLVHGVANLLDNAIKYSDEGSTVEVGAELDESEARLYVRDRGIGIPSDDIERIFERFYRVDKARSRVTGGTGLGLSIVRHIASNHGGTVTVTSREGVGSTFTISLPQEFDDARD